MQCPYFGGSTIGDSTIGDSTVLKNGMELYYKHAQCMKIYIPTMKNLINEDLQIRVYFST